MLRFFVIFTVFAFCGSIQLPEYFSKCSKSDANLNECITKSAKVAWSTMIKGDKSAHILRLVPFHVPFLSARIENTLKGNLSDCTITGLEDTKFESIQIDFDKKTIDCKFLFPRIGFSANYEITGKIIFLPIEGKGPGNFTFLNMDNNLHMEYKLKERNNKQYIEITKTEMKYTTSRAHFRLDNLFGGDEQLGEAMNKVLDESWEAVNKEIGFPVGNALGTAFSAMLQSFFLRVSFNELFNE